MGLFDKQVSRKPNNYPETQQFIDAMWSGFWTSNEFSFKSDYAQFKTQLTEEEKEVVVRTLSAIGQIEVAVKSFWAQLGDHLPHPAIKDLGYVMANSEVIHNIAYEKLLTVLGLEAVFEENLKKDVVANRVKYLQKYLEKKYKDDRKQYVYAICLFTLFVENVSLFSQFYTMMHFNRFDNVLKDVAQQIQYTRNEEMLHAQVGIYLINKLKEEYPELFDEELKERIKQECQAAYEAESKVIDWILQGYTGKHLSAEILKAYIKRRLNDSMEQIGFPKLEESTEEKELIKQTLWMEEETLGSNMTDFFHKRPVEYAKNNKSFDLEDIFKL
jgi:ribonucleoside-diphosphate reductase beta chain